jgi:hypothetical protein
MIALMIAAAVGAAPAESVAYKVIDLYVACRENSFPQPERDVAASEAAKAAYVRKHGGTAEARREIDIACELYRLAYNDGSSRAHAVERTLSPEVKDAIEKEIELQFGPVQPSQPVNQ